MTFQNHKNPNKSHSKSHSVTQTNYEQPVKSDFKNTQSKQFLTTNESIARFEDMELSAELISELKNMSISKPTAV